MKKLCFVIVAVAVFAVVAMAARVTVTVSEDFIGNKGLSTNMWFNNLGGGTAERIVRTNYSSVYLLAGTNVGAPVSLGFSGQHRSIGNFANVPVTVEARIKIPGGQTNNFVMEACGIQQHSSNRIAIFVSNFKSRSTWKIRSFNNGLSTNKSVSADSGVRMVTNSWTTLKMVWKGTKALLYVNDSYYAAVSTSGKIPVSGQFELVPVMIRVNRTNAAAKAVYIDYVDYYGTRP